MGKSSVIVSPLDSDSELPKASVNQILYFDPLSLPQLHTVTYGPPHFWRTPLLFTEQLRTVDCSSCSSEWYIKAQYAALNETFVLFTTARTNLA